MTVTKKNKHQNKYIIFIVLFSVVVALFGGFDVIASEKKESTLKNLEEYRNWDFYNDVIFLKEKNVLLEDSKGKIDPNEEITRAAFVRYIVQALGYKIQQGDCYKDTKGHIDSKYLYTAYINDIIPKSYFGEQFKPDKKITKYEMTYITVNALKLNIYSSQEKFYEDSTSRYANVALDKYLVFGTHQKDGKKYFYPQQTVKKEEVAGVVARAVKYKSSPETYKTEMALKYAENNIITTKSEFYNIISAVIKQRMASFDFRFTLRDSELEKAFNCFLTQRPEYSVKRIEFLIYDDISIKNTVKIQYTNQNSVDKKERNKVDDVIKEFKDKYITKDMSDYDKVKAIHDYIVKNCEYNLSARNSTKMTSAHSAYGALVLKKAVCQGYASAFNLMAKEVGIKSIAVPGSAPKSEEYHMWNAVLIDGKVYYVDATWDDPIPDVKNRINYTYFWKTENEFKNLGYQWDTTDLVEEYFYKVSQ